MVDIETVQRQIAEAIQVRARQETDPEIGIELDGRSGWRIVGSRAYDSLPGEIRTAYEHYGRSTGKVTVHVHGFNYQKVYSKTCTNWTPERVEEAARHIWHEHLRRLTHEAKARQEKAFLSVAAAITDEINRNWSEPGMQIVAKPDGYHLDACLTAAEARDLLERLHTLRGKE